jgi:hypothetical protein
MNEQSVGCIICEETNAEIEFKPMEVNNKTGYVTAEGILQDANVINRNKRYYPEEELRKGIYSARIKELVETGNLIGELSHPLDTSIARQSKIDERNGVCWYKKLWMEGPLVKAWFSGTNNEYGKAFNEDLKMGKKKSFSLRAVGKLVNENGRMTVRGLMPITYDVVVFPSHSIAYTTKIVSESAGVSSDLQSIKEAYSDHLCCQDKFLKKLQEMGNEVDINKPLVVPLTQEEISNYLVHESGNIQTAINTFNVLYESIQLDPNLDTVTMRTYNGDTFRICLEDAVKREIVHGISRYF